MMTENKEDTIRSVNASIDESEADASLRVRYESVSWREKRFGSRHTKLRYWS